MTSRKPKPSTVTDTRITPGARQPGLTSTRIVPGAGQVGLTAPAPAVTELLTRASVKGEMRVAGGKNSGDARRAKTLDRDQRIRAKSAAGDKLETIAADEGLHHSSISRILKRPRP